MNFQFSSANARRLGLGQVDKDESGTARGHIEPGDVVISNLTNPLEVCIPLLLMNNITSDPRHLHLKIIALESFLHSPIFVFPLGYNGELVCLKSLEFFPAFLHVLSSEMQSDATEREAMSKITLKSVVDSARDGNRCVVVFAEGARTNGDGVLEFATTVCSEFLLSLFFVSSIL